MIAPDVLDDVRRLAALERGRWLELERLLRGPVNVVPTASDPTPADVPPSRERIAAEAVVLYAQQSDKWPSEDERKVLKRLNTWRAIRRNDKDVIKKVANWTDTKREYRVDALGSRIAGAWAHYLAGEDPRVTPAQEADVTNLEQMLEANNFASELERAARLCVSEGEIWARGYVDELIAPYALLDWVSRRNVLPYWVGTRLAGAAIITELAKPKDAPKGTVYRHLEVHAPGIVLNVLFVGKEEKLGRRGDLDQHPATAMLEEEWNHGINFGGSQAVGLLCRIPNYVDDDVRVGVSDYEGILDDLLDLNEAKVIGAVNAKLTARKRAIVSSAVLRPRPRNDLELTPEEAAGDITNAPTASFDPTEEVLVEDPLDRELGKAAEAPFRILEYSFDAEPLIAYKRDLVESAVSRCGLNTQYVGVGVGPEGYAISGTALRLRFIPTDKTGRGKARYWDDAVPRILGGLARLDALAPGFGGLGRQWSDPVTPPTFTRQPGIPVDEVEEAQKHQAQIAAGVKSRRTAIRELHPSWSDADVDAELDAIREDQAAASAGSLPLGP